MLDVGRILTRRSPPQFIYSFLRHNSYGNPINV